MTTTVELEGPPVANITMQGNAVLCKDETSLLVLEAYDSSFSLKWMKNGSVIANASGPQLEVSESGNYSVEISNTTGCSSVSNVIAIERLADLSAAIVGLDEVCVNTSFTLSANMGSGSTEGIQFIWNLGNNQIKQGQNIEHTFTRLDDHIVSLTVRYANAGCDVTVTKTIKASTAPELVIENLSGEKCFGEDVTLAVADNFDSYSWSNGATGSSITVTEPGIYDVIVATAGGCSATATYELQMLPLPELTIAADKDIVSVGEKVALTASGAYSYEWSPAVLVDNPYVANPTATISETTTFVVTGYSENGCVTEQEITIQLDETLNVRPAKSFSPNGDNIDDYWRIERIEFYPEAEVKLFDRMGRLLYRAQPYNNDWDGAVAGRILPADAYYFVIVNPEGKILKSGSVSILQ